MTNQTPTYKIHGKERRKLKKELFILKSLIKNFWNHHALEKDMDIIFKQEPKMNNNEANILFESYREKAKKLEDMLNILN